MQERAKTKSKKQTAAKILPLALAFALTLGLSLASPARAGGYPDAAGHWGEAAIERWSGYGVLRGYEDGTFAPDRAMTADELATILANTFGYTETYEGTLPGYAGGWGEKAVRKAVAAGAVEPAEAGLPLTRELAAKIIAKALAISPVEGKSKFTDDGDISAQYRPYVTALGGLGVFNGDEKGAFMPQSGFRRAEITQVLDNAVTDIVSEDGTVSSSRSVIVSKPGVTLSRSAIEGDLIIGQGVGGGDVTLDYVTVKGRLVVLGGGEHSIVIKGGSKVAAVVTGKPNVHIQLERGAVVQSIEITEGGVSVTVSYGATVETLVIDADGAAVEGGGRLAQVTVKPEASGALVKTPNTIIINDSRDYVTTDKGVVKTGDTQTTPGAPVGSGGGSGGGGGSSYYPPSSYTPSDPDPEPSPDAPAEIRTVEVDTAENLVEMIKAGTENVRIVAAEDMTITANIVGEYEPFGAYDLLIKDRSNSTLYIPEGVTLIVESGVTFRVGSDTALEIDGTLNLLEGAGMWVGGKLTVNGTLVCTGFGGLMIGQYAVVGGSSASVAGILLPKKSYYYNIGFDYTDGVYTNGNIFWANTATEEQLRDAINDSISSINIYGSFEITSPIEPRLWVIEDEAVITVKSDFTVQGTLNVAGEIRGAEGGRVIIPANARIKNVLWGGGWISEEAGTGVLYGLPVDWQTYERVFTWTDGAWVLQAGQSAQTQE
ncbi:MAG: S-layer homology domain-containing protein [Oscillospiraceae bacterium]|jgi:hypothetical protein|nr:S-layer homology domain-containing protein [Oscillospiraceae bacterium]